MESRCEKNKQQQESIEEEEKREKRKKIAKIIFIVLILLFLLFSACYFYITYIATKRLIVKEKVVTSEKIPDSFQGLKIIQFSDIHYGSTFSLADLKEVVGEINKRNPDLVFFTGDLIDSDYELKTDEAEKIMKELKKIHVTIGKYAVSGEEDIESFQTIMNQSDFSILTNDYDLVYRNDNHPILLVGLGSLSVNQDIDHAFRYFKEDNHNSNIYTIALFHEPDSISSIKSNYSVDLGLAGHSHNGEVRLPFIGGLSRVEGAIDYHDSFYEFDNTKLYISSGLGSSYYHMRLFNRPSISFFRLRK